MSKQFKITLLLIGLAIVSSVLHNLVSGLFEFEEPVFFILTFVFLLGAIVFAIYNMIRSLITRKG